MSKRLGSDSATFKVCTNCGKEFTLKQWRALKLLGHQIVEADEIGPEEKYELRNCPICNSTLAVQV